MLDKIRRIFKEGSEDLDMTNGKCKIKVKSHLRIVPGKARRTRIESHSRSCASSSGHKSNKPKRSPRRSWRLR